MTGFHDYQGILSCAGVRLVDLADAVGTPSYVYSANEISRRYLELTRSLSKYPHAVHYALKANSTLGIVKLLRGLGASVDVNSAGEMEVALRVGYTPQEIVFTGVGKTTDELLKAVSLGVKTINVESPGELARIQEIARAHKLIANVSVRVNPDIDALSHPHISTGIQRSKFGVPIEDALTIYREAARREELKLVGVHAHIGSQIVIIEPIRQATRMLIGLAQELAQSGIVLEHVDVGGGLGISHDGSKVVEITDYATMLIDEFHGSNLTMLLEPGRWLVGPAGVLISRVVDLKKQSTDRFFAVLDAGMSEFMRPALYGARHRLIPAVARSGSSTMYDVVGPLCESSDSFGTDHYLPPLEVGDVIGILDAGAYGSTMSSNYNRRPRPAEVLVEGEQWRLIKSRESLEGMLTDEFHCL